ncbi:hypothetical protein JCM3766R1_005578 [Sporobolomyces carnicolor]
MKRVAVIGATGVQGGGVVSALLSDPSKSFHVVAITTNPGSHRARSILSKYADKIKDGRFELVVATLNDEESLVKALEGCQLLFASFGPGAPPEQQGGEPEELKQGKNLVRAAEAVGIEHFVYSSLTSLKEESKGKYTDIHHHEAKAAVEDFAKERLKFFTTIKPAAFYTNLGGPGWVRRQGDGTALFCAPFQSNVRLAWTDAGYDVGNFALAIFHKGGEATNGKSYFCADSRAKSIGEIASEYHAVTGEKVAVEPLPIKQGAALTTKDLGFPESFEQELEDTFTWFNELYADLPSDALEYPTNQVYEELGVKASSLAQYLERSGWRVQGH